MSHNRKDSFANSLFTAGENALSIARCVVKDTDSPDAPINSALNAATVAMENAQSVADMAPSALRHAETILSVGSFVVENADTVASVGSFAINNAETIVEVAGVTADIGGALLC